METVRWRTVGAGLMGWIDAKVEEMNSQETGQSTNGE